MKKSKISSYYITIWRWHFYAGVFVAPFLIVLAATGLGMVLLANTTGRDNDRIKVVPEATSVPISTQAKNALATLPDTKDGLVAQYTAPRSQDTVALFRVKSVEKHIDNMVLVNPYTGQVITTFPRQSNLYHKLDNLHGELMMGKTGDFIQELTASLTILLIITGIFLWWQKNSSMQKMLIPNKIDDLKKRSTFRTIHATLGSWVALVLLFFCISGLAWAGIWGEKMVQAWNQFPAGKWGVEPTPISVLPNSPPQAMPATLPPSMQGHIHGSAGEQAIHVHTHGNTLNDGKTKEVPWVLEFTPMPRSGTSLGKEGLPTGMPITLDSVDNYARQLGFVGRYQINLPQDDKGVWTMSQDSMSYDMTHPMADRTVHVDRYTGKILADIRYQDYNAFGKFMAAGLALHMGTMGWASILANVLFCLAVIVISISGLVMCWQRRPTNTKGLQAPASGKKLPVPWSFAGLLLVVACIFPTAIMAIGMIAILDFVVLQRVKKLQSFFA